MKYVIIYSIFKPQKPHIRIYNENKELIYFKHSAYPAKSIKVEACNKNFTEEIEFQTRNNRGIIYIGKLTNFIKYLYNIQI